MDSKVSLPDKDWIAWIGERAILAPKNTTVDLINQVITTNFPGKLQVLSSADSITEGATDNFQVEFLNTLTPNGSPPHNLALKVLKAPHYSRKINIGPI